MAKKTAPSKNRNICYGWQPDLPDHRDFVFNYTARRLDPVIDLRAGMPKVYDQGELGSCTANAIAAALEYDQAKQGLKAFVPSRLFIYYGERSMEGTIASDSGAQIRDGIKVVASLGAPPETEWKYIPSKFAVKPTAKAYADALKNTALKYQRVPQTIPAIQAALAAGFPVVFGFTVYEAFESDAVAKSGIVPMPAKGEAVVGGHAVLCCGVDVTKRLALVRNSWGAKWGQKGYFQLPFDYITNPSLADDFWTIQSVK